MKTKKNLIYVATEEEKKEINETATKILSWMHEFENNEKAYLIHAIIKKFERMSGIDRRDLCNDLKFIEPSPIKEDEIEEETPKKTEKKDLNLKKELSL